MYLGSKRNKERRHLVTGSSLLGTLWVGCCYVSRASLRLFSRKTSLTKEVLKVYHYVVVIIIIVIIVVIVIIIIDILYIVVYIQYLDVVQWTKNADRLICYIDFILFTSYFLIR